MELNTDSEIDSTTPYHKDYLFQVLKNAIMFEGTQVSMQLLASYRIIYVCMCVCLSVYLSVCLLVCLCVCIINIVLTSGINLLCRLLLVETQRLCVIYI